MKVIIAGSRTITDRKIVEEAIRKSGFDIDIVICGCAMGVDQIGKNWAEMRNITIYSFPAKWEKYGKAAGPIRNEEMAKNADALILVWDGKSKGSANMLKQAKKYNLKIYERVVNIGE